MKLNKSFPKKIGFDECFDVTICLQLIEFSDVLRMCAMCSELPSNISTTLYMKHHLPDTSQIRPLIDQLGNREAFEIEQDFANVRFCKEKIDNKQFAIGICLVSAKHYLN